MVSEFIYSFFGYNKLILTKLAVSSDEGLAVHFSMDDKAFRNSVEIGDGIFVWTNTNTQSKLSVLGKVFKLYDIDATELVFYLRDETKDNSDEEGTRFELRRRYWTYALDFIKKAH